MCDECDARSPDACVSVRYVNVLDLKLLHILHFSMQIIKYNKIIHEKEKDVILRESLFLSLLLLHFFIVSVCLFFC